MILKEYDKLLLFLANAWNDINSKYNEKFTLSSAIWTKYIFQSIALGTGQDQTECGVYCELSIDKCDFFLISAGKCHLGRYDYYGSGSVSSNDVPTTYHKSSMSYFLIVVIFFELMNYFFQVLLNHTFFIQSLFGLAKLKIGQNGSTNTKEDLWVGNVPLNVTMMTIVITMLTFMDIVCMVDFHTLVDKSFIGRTTQMFMFKKAKVHLPQSLPTTIMMHMETRINQPLITGTGEQESMDIILISQVKSYVLGDVWYLGSKGACFIFGAMDIASWVIT